MRLKNYFFFLGALFCVLALILGLSIFTYPYLFDDISLIEQNYWLRIEAISSYFFSFIADSGNSFIGYRPLIWTSLALEKYVWGGDPAHFRCVNLFFHFINAYLVYLIFSWKKELKNYQLIALISSFIFLIHPINVNIIQLIWKRSDLFVTFGILGAIVCLQRRNILGLVGFACIAFFSKENAVTLLPSLLLFSLFFPNDPNPKNIGHRYVWIPAVFILTLAHLWICLKIWPQVITQFGMSQETYTPSFYRLGRIDYLLLQVASFPEYVRLALFPLSQRVFHYIPPPTHAFYGQFLLGLVLIGGFLTLAFKFFKQRHVISFCLLWFLLHLLPTSSLVPLNLPFDEDRLYLPMFASCFLMAFLIARINKPKILTLAVVGIAGFYISQSAFYFTRWESPITLWAHNVKTDSEDPRPWLALALAWSAKGDPEKALTLMDKALQLDPNYKIIPYHQGVAKMQQQKWEEAKQLFEKSLKSQVMESQSLMNLGSIAANLRSIDEALARFDQSIAMNPYNMEAYRNKARLLRQEKRPKEALATLKQAILWEANDPSTLSLIIDLLKELNVKDEELEPLIKALKS